MKSIIVNLTGDDILPKELDKNTRAIELPGWTVGSFYLVLQRVEWLEREIRKIFECEDIENVSLTVYVPCTALSFGLVMALQERLPIKPRVIVQDGKDLVDLSGFTEKKETIHELSSKLCESPGWAVL